MFVLASDYDGTLNRNGISERDRDAVKMFREAGNLFGVVTGRDARFYNTIREQGPDIDFIVALNGAMQVGTAGADAGKVTRAEVIKNNGLVRGVTELAGSFGSWLSCVSLTGRKYFHADFPDGNEKYSPLAETESFEDIVSMNACCATKEEARACTAEVNRLFGKYLNALQNCECIDIPPAGTDKGEGVARFAAERGIDEDLIYTAGDHMNDMAMITRFHGCAVSNACAEIKAAAEGVYEDIAAIIEYIMSK